MSTFAYYTEVAVSTTDAAVLPAENHRRALGISSSSSNATYFAFGKPATVSSSIRALNGGPMQWFFREDLGPLIDTELHAISTGGPGTLAIVVSKDG